MEKSREIGPSSLAVQRFCTFSHAKSYFGCWFPWHIWGAFSLSRKVALGAVARESTAMQGAYSGSCIRIGGRHPASFAHLPHPCPLQGHSAKLSRICTGIRQLAAGRVPPSRPANTAPGRMGPELTNVFLFHRPFVHALSQKRLRFLSLRALRAPERPQCLFLLRLPGQSRGNAAKGIGSMV